MADLLKIKVKRPFQMNGKPVKKNSVLEVGKKFAHELVNNHKAVFVDNVKPEVIKGEEK